MATGDEIKMQSNDFAGDPAHELPDPVRWGVGLVYLRVSVTTSEWRFWVKVANWIIALCGLWEFGDIAALFVPDFGPIKAFVWNHIIVGFILMMVGAWAAQTSDVRVAKKLDWTAAAAGVWLIIAPFLLGLPEIAAGLWNDIIVGTIVIILGVWAALSATRAAG